MNDTPTVTLVEPQKVLSEGELKKLRKQYVTIQHPRVSACGHKLDMGRKPRLNCQHCWFAFFQNHGEMVQQLDEMYTQEGKELIIQLQGIQFYDMWRKFLSTVANWKQENNE